MKNLQEGSVPVAALVIIVITLMGGGIFLYHQNREPQTDSGFLAGKTAPYGLDEQPTKEYTDDIRAYSANGEIKTSFQSFRAFADNHKSTKPESLCKGGFINTEESGLMNIADRIIKNRILNLNPLEYAKNQDEAGITCVASADKWVLFSALNAHSKDDGKNFYCIDSSGENGNVNFDRDSVQCLK